ncbi:helix-turn-helix domain-containing protein [Actinomadura opuntiae]|uniref:helix-turn-helix domain-containing protein n=1 Tax=Actinomadura sp. OS1-43 TaxID=604315 RepID=UPI00255ABDB7|nr:helix-turn-helix domain-containing protein [Actinomadura sp. OS1-43]MDL4812794.1 helix-turn-helix domain-containing protein [Actinomadura sp. OS1-43]
MPGPTQYMSAADIADLFGVNPGTVEKWRQRYDTFPEPDAVTGIGRPIAGWLPSREDELRAWHAFRPGQGAGGGRPRRKDTPRKPDVAAP